MGGVLGERVRPGVRCRHIRMRAGGRLDIRSSLRDFCGLMAGPPAVETAGYCRVFLRNKGFGRSRSRSRSRTSSASQSTWQGMASASQSAWHEAAMCGAIRCTTQAGRRVWPFRSAGRRPGRAGRPFYPVVCRTRSRSVKPSQGRSNPGQGRSNQVKPSPQTGFLGLVYFQEASEIRRDLVRMR